MSSLTLSKPKETKALLLGQAAQLLKDAPRIPLFLSPVCAGFPSPADDYIEDKLNLHEYLVKNESSTFFLHASGDSMIGAGIYDGDLLIVDRAIAAEHNKIVIAALDGELTVKRLVRHDGKAYLAPENPDYPKFDITDREHVHVWGVVTSTVHRLA